MLALGFVLTPSRAVVEKYVGITMYFCTRDPVDSSCDVRGVELVDSSFWSARCFLGICLNVVVGMAYINIRFHVTR